MYSILILGQIPGTNFQINFTLWCLIGSLIIWLFIYYQVNPRFKADVKFSLKLLRVKLVTMTKNNLLVNIAGNQGFAVELQVFEQNFTTSICMLGRQLLDTIKIKRE